MKKFFTFVMAAFMAVPMFAATVIFDESDFKDQGKEGTGDVVTATKEGVTFTCSAGYGKYGVRCYKNSHVTISAEENIVSIEFEFYQTYNGGLDPKICVGAKSWEVASLASQARMTTITVTTGEGSCEEAQVEEINVAQALEIAQALTPEKKKSASTTVKYAVKGYVVGTSSKYENTYYMADEKGAYGEFEAFKCASVDSEVKEDDYVMVTGYIQHYWGENSQGEEYHTYEISGGVLVHTDAPEGIENVVFDGPKAVKVMENGQMIIIRNGVKYNATGAVVE